MRTFTVGYRRNAEMLRGLASPWIVRASKSARYIIATTRAAIPVLIVSRRLPRERILATFFCFLRPTGRNLPGKTSGVSHWLPWVEVSSRESR